MTKPEPEPLSWHPELSDKTEPADGSARSDEGNPGPGLVDPAPSVLQQRLGFPDSSHDSVPGLLIGSAFPHADEQGDLRARFDQHYFTEAKAFMLACFPNEEAWQQWTEEIGGKIAEDLYIVSFENNREPPYSTDQFLRAAEAYYRYGLTAKSIQENYPDVPVCRAIPLIRDLAVLTNPSLARTFGFTTESCQRAAKRIVGEEPRTAQQFAYQWLYTDVPQLSDPNSTLFAEWKRALRELRNPLTTGGRFYHVHEDDAVRLVQMICQSGYS